MALTVWLLLDTGKSYFQNFLEIGMSYKAVSERGGLNGWGPFSSPCKGCSHCHRQSVHNIGVGIFCLSQKMPHKLYQFPENSENHFFSMSKSNPTFCAIYGHVSSAAILYTKPKGLYFHLVKYHGDWSSHS